LLLCRSHIHLKIAMTEYVTMSEKEAKPLVPLVITFLIVFGWLIFILLHALFWSTDFTFFQNMIITVVSLLMAGLFIGLIWVVWGMRT
jgi:predicted membrane channel-forming protein YqfA (hemolysin III family)